MLYIILFQGCARKTTVDRDNNNGMVCAEEETELIIEVEGFISEKYLIRKCCCPGEMIINRFSFNSWFICELQYGRHQGLNEDTQLDLPVVKEPHK